VGTQHSVTQSGIQPPPNFRPICCGQMAAWIKMLLGREIGLYPSNIVLDGDPALPPQKGGQSPNFRPMSIVPNGWMDQDSTWRGGGPWSRPHCTRWGPSYPPQKGGRVPQFSAHLYCGQTAGCIKMPLGMKVGLRPGDFVLDGTQPPPQKGAEHPNFRPMSIAAKRLDGSRWHLAWRWALVQATSC